MRKNPYNFFFFAGRTMDFTFDMSQTPLIGRKVVGGTCDSESVNFSSLLLQRRSTSLSPSDSVVPGWKRPWLCQVMIFSYYNFFFFTRGV